MLKIALCDDEPEQLRHLQSMLTEYHQLNPDCPLSFDAFLSPEHLLERIKGYSSYQIYLLDILMPGCSGISLGKEIRKIDEEAKIIYLTVTRDYAVESYSVHAFYYLVKPFDKKDLFRILDRALKPFLRQLQTVLQVKTRDGILPLKESLIQFVEYHSHILSYHMDGGQIVDSLTVRESFDQAASSFLNNSIFVKISYAYIVNLAYVAKMTKKGFLMKDGTELVVTRSFSDARKEYMKHLLKGGTIDDL